MWRRALSISIFAVACLGPDSVAGLAREQTKPPPKAGFALRGFPDRERSGKPGNRSATCERRSSEPRRHIETRVTLPSGAQKIFTGADERERGVVQIKDLVEGKKKAAAIADHQEWREERPGQFEVKEKDLVQEVAALLKRQAEA